MQTKPKSNTIVTSRYDEARSIIIFTVKDCGDVELDLLKVSQANNHRAAIHGWNQRIPDAAAISRTDKDGHIIPEQTRTRIKYERMNDLCRHYESGTERWSMVREAGESGGGTLVVEAIARVQGVDYAEAEARVERYADRNCEGDTAKALAILRKGPTLAGALREIQAERDAKRAGADVVQIAEAALAELEESAAEE